jgi:hypothetical protein
VGGTGRVYVTTGKMTVIMPDETYGQPSRRAATSASRPISSGGDAGSASTVTVRDPRDRRYSRVGPWE